MMTPGRTTSLLRLTAALLWVATLAAAAALALLPYDGPPSTTVDVSMTRPTTGPTSAPAAVTFDDLPDLDLRRPLVDPPTTAPVGAAALAATGPDVRLTGIVAEPGHSFAVFATPAGGTEVRTVGQRAGGFEIVAISPVAVTGTFAGRTTTLRLPVPPRPGG